MGYSLLSVLRTQNGFSIEAIYICGGSDFIFGILSCCFNPMRFCHTHTKYYCHKIIMKTRTSISENRCAVLSYDIRFYRSSFIVYRSEFINGGVNCETTSRHFIIMHNYGCIN